MSAGQRRNSEIMTQSLQVDASCMYFGQCPWDSRKETTRFICCFVCFFLFKLNLRMEPNSFIFTQIFPKEPPIFLCIGNSTQDSKGVVEQIFSYTSV